MSSRMNFCINSDWWVSRRRRIASENKSCSSRNHPSLTRATTLLYRASGTSVCTVFIRLLQTHLNKLNIKSIPFTLFAFTLAYNKAMSKVGHVFARMRPTLKGRFTRGHRARPRFICEHFLIFAKAVQSKYLVSINAFFYNWHLKLPITML